MGVDGISLFLVLLTTFLVAHLDSGVVARSFTKRVKGFFIALLVLETGDDRRVRLARPVPVLPVLGSDADPDVFPDRHLGPRSAHLRGTEIHFVHDVRLDPDAGRDPVALQLAPARSISSQIQAMLHARTRFSPAATRNCCSSALSSWRSRSRCRCFRCTPGCPTRIPKRPRPAL